MNPWIRYFWLKKIALPLGAVLAVVALWLASAPLGVSAVLTLAAGFWGLREWDEIMGLALAPRAVFPRRPGNRVRFLIDGNAVIGRMVEEIRSARERIWLTIAFFDTDLPLLPPHGGTFLELLAKKAREGVDVRLLFWRMPAHDAETFAPGGGHVFFASEKNRSLLASLDAPLKVRWDDRFAGCQHQKSMIVDSRVGFCGGVNLVTESLDDPAHVDRFVETPWHDVACELQGPVLGDLEGNFIQRWNAAVGPEPWPDRARADDLPLKNLLGYRSLGTEAHNPGGANVQLVRTIPSLHYKGCELDVPGPGKASPSIWRKGEASLLHAYLDLIESAEHSLYLENQYFFFSIGAYRLNLLPREVLVRDSKGRLQHVLARALCDATRRGVYVWLLLPGNPQFVGTSRKGLTHLEDADFTKLGLFSLARDYSSLLNPRYYRPIYIHSKLFIADGARCCIGSGN
ncbi:MAG: phosphatidylserine/phosphatidylglycerophosphate/cardiolipin synthase family protein, partial [Chrysiogenetes bacterium]|nr:phosphatidylserine/phosphatidylglycerophosphate/cardiolipin synthase family protein [Chrysiogenetes bacterium]